jgi:hypothetical protein
MAKGETKVRDRLIEVLGDFPIFHSTMKERWFPEAVERLADYLLAEGVIVPTHKIGAKVYVIASQTSDDKNLYIFEDNITHYRICDGCTIMCLEKHMGVPSWRWNKVFLTREEAEKALERSENGK